MLHTMLGEWNHNANKTCQWNYITHPRMQTISVQLPNQLNHYYQLSCTSWHHLYYSQPDTNAPTTTQGDPVTIKQLQQGFWVHNKLTRSHTNPLQPHLKLDEQSLEPYIETCPVFLQTLEPDHSDANQQSHRTQMTFKHNKLVTWIVSDASLNTQKHSAFSWTITTSSTKMWIRSGTAPRNPMWCTLRISKSF